VADDNVVSGLAGKASGVSIIKPNTMGGSANVLIRGSTSLTQNNQALFVVDGIPMDNTNTNSIVSQHGTNQNQGWGGFDFGNAAMDIDPNDIENVSVLKGAAATALYGSRAANGVILITTKKGSRAAPGKKKIGFTWNSSVLFNQADMSTAPKWQNQYGGGYGPFYEDPETAHFFYADLDGDGVNDLIATTSEDASWGEKFDPNLMVIQWDALDPLQDNYAEKRPWVAGANDLDYFFKTGYTFTNNFTFSAANENGAFRLSYTNLDQTGILVNSELKRNTLNFSGDYNFTEKLKVEANVTYVNTNAKGRFGTGYDGLNPMQSFGQWFERNVDLKRLDEGYLRPNGEQLSWNSSYYNDLNPIYFDNPYYVRRASYEDDYRDRIYGYTALTYKFSDNLSFSGKGMLDTYNQVQNERIAYGSVDDSYYSNFTNTVTELNFELMLKYNKTWDKFSLHALIGSNARKNKFESIQGNTVGGLVVPGLYTVSNSVSPYEVRENLIESGINSLFGSVSLGWNSFLYLDLTDRYDVSSTLPTDNNGYNYWSGSLSFVLTEMAAMRDISWMPLLKLRANYAEVGNDAPAYSLISTYSQNTNWDKNPLFSVNSTLQNPNLVPERTKSLEFGLEAHFLQSRIRLDVAQYKSTTYNQILPVAVSPMSGYSRMWVNGGEMENKGWEVGLVVVPIESKDWHWDIGANWYTNQNKVISLFTDASGVEVTNILIYSAWDVSVNATVGEPYGTIRGTDFIYTNGEKTVDENGYYLKSEAGDEVIGNIQPDWKMGIPTTLSWKGLRLYALIDIQKGGDIYSVSTKYGQATGLYAETAGTNRLGNPMRDNLTLSDGTVLSPHFSGGVPIDQAGENSGGTVLPGVKEDGSPNDILVNSARWGRAFYYNNSPTARYVFDASYTKLREVSLTYTFPKRWFEKVLLQDMSLGFVGRNLWIISKNVEHFDPEASLGSGNNQGIETGSYPTARSFGFNLRLGF
ncbi:MAG: SusC/RagA family TonB-linked outer membrane protein, partial [Bacteroidales bacterium]|nr:SusC/RagA family TonB-linked outer membrane protein [Bacteroidales bacterium]